jgi:hypothetical protein
MNGDRWAGAALLAAGMYLGAAAGCAAVQYTESKPVAEFPPAQSLTELAARPAVVPHVEAGDTPPEGWIVEAAPSEGVAPDEIWQPQGEFERAFAAAIGETARKPRLTRPLACVARELGRFYLEKKAPPSDALREFMIAACDAVVPQVSFRWLDGSAPAQISEAALLERWGGQLRTDVTSRMPAEATEAGFWFGRAGTRVVALLAFAAPRARLATRSFQPDAAGNVILEGEIESAADMIYGFVNQGPFGVARCIMDPSVARPRFHATCPMLASDQTAWIQLFFAPPKRVLANLFVQVLARRIPTEALVYKEESYGDPHPVTSAEQLTTAVLAELNAVRAKAHLAPVRLSAGESATAAHLAGHYFSAELGGQRWEEMDRIALGLMAGWQVSGMIRDGRFVSNLTPHTRDAGRWLTATLSMPMGRATLLAPTIEEIAFGPLVLSETEGLGAIIVGYELHHGSDHADDVSRLYARLAEARKRLGQGPATHLPGMAEAMRGQLERVYAGEQPPSQALHVLLQRGVWTSHKNMRGYLIEAVSVDAVEIPAEIVRQPLLDIEIGVTHHRPKGAAWAQLVILVVYADYSGSFREVRAPGGPRRDRRLAQSR